jgi:hypothetical protein
MPLPMALLISGGMVMGVPAEHLSRSYSQHLSNEVAFTSCLFTLTDEDSQ